MLARNDSPALTRSCRKRRSKTAVPLQAHASWVLSCPVPRRQQLGPRGGGRVTMATSPQSSLSNSSTMYNCSVYRKNADHIFWFSMHNTSLGKNAEPTRRSSRCTFPSQPNLFLVLGEYDGWGSIALPATREDVDCPASDSLARGGSPCVRPRMPPT